MSKKFKKPQYGGKGYKPYYWGRTGNLASIGSFNKLSAKRTMNKRYRSNKGFYKLAFIETYNKVTDLDIDHRLDYGKDLISKYTKVASHNLYFKEKKKTKTMLGYDEVYYVYTKSVNIGKLSISYKKTDLRNKMTFLFKTRDIMPTNTGSRNKKYKSKTEANRNRNRNRGKAKL